MALEADFLTRYDPPSGGVIPGIALFGSFIPQVEVVPEWLWFHTPLGLGLATYWSRPVSAVDASVTTFHLLAGAGLTLGTPLHFRLAAELGVLTPWTVTGLDWREARGRDSIPVNTGIGFVTGGLSAKLSVTYGF